MDQAVDAAFESNKYPEVGNGLDLTSDFVVALMGRGKFLPRIPGALFHPE